MKTGLTAIAFCLTFCYVPQPSVAKENLFNVLNNYIDFEGTTVLDL